MAQHPEYPQDDDAPREPSSLDQRLQAEEPPIQADDTNPSRPVTVHPDLADRLRAEEPPIQADDTAPTPVVSITERIAAEEPPLQADDTNPRRPVMDHDTLSDRLRAEEPPIQAGDTSPSRVVAVRGSTTTVRGSTTTVRGSAAQRVLGLVMLLGAVVLTGVAGTILLDSNETDGESERVALATTGPAPSASVPVTAASAAPSTMAAPTRPATAVPAEHTPDAAAPTEASPGEIVIAATLRPTAAADEIAVALNTSPIEVVSHAAIARDSAPFTIRPGSQRTHVVSYIVKDGDTLQSIAAQFELKDFYTLVWSNPSNKYNPLRAGVDLNVPPVDGVYYEATDTISIGTVAQELGVDPYSIIDAEYNNLFGSTPETLLVKGMRVMVPGGKAKTDLFFLSAPSGTGTVSGGVVTGTYSLWGCSSEISGGTMPYGRPLERYTYMQGFRVGGHTGVDIAPGSGRVGDPIYASGGGTVAYAGWSDGGYGYVVVIAHGSVFSLYAHMNGQPSVGCGQKVSQGSVIGMVGSSGNSSGPHLHFEIRDANFNLLNPASYVSF